MIVEIKEKKRYQGSHAYNMTTINVFIHKRVTMTSHMELKAKAKKIFESDHCLVSQIRSDTRKLALVDSNLYQEDFSRLRQESQQT
jgi:hypothetical protein